MSNSLTLGIDCSETLLHAAAITPADSTPQNVQFQPDPHVIVCDRLMPGSTIGVGFPSVLRMIGTQRRIGAAEGSTLENTLESRFSVIVHSFTSLTGSRPDHTVIAVPAILTEVRRRGLIAAAGQAGLRSVQLIDRSLAAAAGFSDRSEARKTLLVVTADYSSVELALIRGNKGRYRTLANTVIEGLGDQQCQQHIMEEAVLQFQERKIFLGLKSMGTFQWLSFRDRVLHDWSRFIGGEDMTITWPVDITKFTTPVQTMHSRAAFQKWLDPQLDNLVESARGLLEQCGVSTGDVEHLLLVGADSQLALVARCLNDALNIPPARGSQGMLAEGAALLAVNADPAIAGAIVAEPAPGTDGAAIAPGDVPMGSLAPPPNGGPPFTNPTPPASPLNSNEEDNWTLGAIRQRWEAGDHEIAIRLLDTLLVSASQMRDHWMAQITAAKKHTEPRGTPRQFIAMAFDELGRGELDSAIAWSHQAYQGASGNPEIFAGMMKVHLEAATRMVRPEDYQHSIQTLLCAHQHDQTDRAIQKALAARHYQHALVMVKCNNITNALDCLRQAIQFDPRDADIVALREELEANAASSG